jgi:hypothetical protein
VIEVIISFAAGSYSVVGAHKHRHSDGLPPRSQAGVVEVSVSGHHDIGYGAVQCREEYSPRPAIVRAGIDHDQPPAFANQINVVVSETDAFDGCHSPSVKRTSRSPKFARLDAAAYHPPRDHN